jgi:meiotically up-regulated gene 157 (Mug157) protein
MPPFATQRPSAHTRRFTNNAVELLIKEIAGSIADPELAWLFTNCLPNTLDTTIDHRVVDGRPDTYVITGDIDAMWLRDSAAQVWPYLPLAAENEPLRELIAGVINRQAKSILLDPYANAFYRDPVFGYWKSDLTQMLPGVHERKWELDSLAYFLRLSYAYWTTTKDLSPFDETWTRAVSELFALLRIEQSIGDDPKRSPYTFQRVSGHHLGSHSCNVPSLNCGLVRCSFRPSDDMVKLPFLIPANAMMAVELNNSVCLLNALNQAPLAVEAHAIAETITRGLETCGTVTHPVHGEIWAYETDGLGNANLMDDANAPSLLSLPYLGFCPPNDPRYLRTRSFCLSSDNPHYVSGAAAAGIGSPHTGPGTIWPMALIMQALTSTSDAEILQCLQQLKATHAGTGFMHESFNAEDPARFTRPWFAWANTLFGELIVTLFRQRPHLLGVALPDPRCSLV